MMLCFAHVVPQCPDGPWQRQQGACRRRRGATVVVLPAARKCIDHRSDHRLLSVARHRMRMQVDGRFPHRATMTPMALRRTVAVGVCAVLALASVARGARADAQKPNIVVVVADDLGWCDVPFNCNSNVKTPTLSALAKKGVVLNNTYVNAICTPTRTSLMSGYYPIHVGLQHGVILDAVPAALNITVKTMADHMKEAGYSTAMVGKWHLGYHQPRFTPQRRGFDSYYGYYTGNEEYWNHTSPCWHCGENFTAVDLHDANATHDRHVLDKAGVYSAELFGQRAVSVIEQHDMAKPLFVYLPFESVHGAASCDPDCNDPSGDLLQAPQRFIDAQSHIHNMNRRTFAGMVGALDEAVANVTAALKAKGMLENTLIVFTTDNGAPSSHFNGTAMTNAPLRGTKGSLWEGGVRAAAFVHGAGLAPSVVGSTYNGLIHVSDWIATLTHVAGGAPPVDDIDGYNVWDAIASGAPSPRDHILHNIDPVSNNAAVRVGNFKLMRNQGAGTWWGQANRADETSTAVPARRGRGGAELVDGKRADYLFDIWHDPEERHNLIDDPQHAGTVAQLQAVLDRYNASMVPLQVQTMDAQALVAAKAAGDVWVPWQEDPDAEL